MLIKLSTNSTHNKIIIQMHGCSNEKLENINNCQEDLAGQIQHLKVNIGSKNIPQNLLNDSKVLIIHKFFF